MPLSSPTMLSRIIAESGFYTVAKSSRDAKLLCLQRFARLFAYGTSFLILVHFLSSLNFSDEQIGLFMTLTLLGDVVISFFLTLSTDQVGRRRVLAAGAVLMSMSGLAFASTSNYWMLVLASVIGVISPSGNEIGPFRAVEESILAQLTDKNERSDMFAWYTMFGTAGAALGTLTSGWVVQVLQSKRLWTQTSAYRVIFGIYSLFGIVKLILTIMLSNAVEVELQEPEYNPVGIELEDDTLLSGSSNDENSDCEGETSFSIETPSKVPKVPSIQPKPTIITRIRSTFPHISPLSRSILIRLIILFAIDSFASGLASPSWLTYFFTTIHLLKPSTLGTLFLITNICATISNLLALPLARRLGPLKTMTFTHLPSAIFLSLIPIPSASTSGTWVSMALLSLRACTQSMDQAPRQAFIAAAVLPAERTAVLGIVNVAKTLAQAGGIGSAGVLAGHKLWILLLGGAGTLKASYDLIILWMFLGLKDREDENKARGKDEESR